MLEPFIVGLVIGWVLVQVMKHIDGVVLAIAYWCLTCYMMVKSAVKEMVHHLHLKD